jgi:large subunit ribosomal protein L17
MMHNIAGKRLGRNTAHRAALRKNFTVSVIQHERVVTTMPKAKALRPFVEKIITLARSADQKTKLARIRRAVALLQDKAAVKKLFEVIGPRFANRAGGYTRILRLPDYRIGDGGTKVVFELVENNVLEQKIKAKEAAATKETEAAATATAGAGAKA